jgi:NADH-quinone oxidoreductase subunit N
MFSPSFNAIIPMVSVTLAGLACMLAEAFREREDRMPIGGLGIIGLVGAAIASILLWGRGSTSFGVVSADDFGLFITLILVVIGLLTIAFSGQITRRDRLPAGEYYALMLFALAGMMLMAVATDLLVMFLALEVFSLAVYVLTAIRRESRAGIEGAFKYFLLGSFSSAFFLYGISFAYGAVGSTNLDRIGMVVAARAGSESGLIILALVLLLVGFGFKVAAVPFHMWTPDAYQGAPTIVTGFMSTAVKAAAFAAFARVFLSTLEPLRPQWAPVLWTLSAATMVLGTLAAVAQTNVKRMLAYSSIAHGGYLLIAMVAANQVGKAAILFYLLVYAVTNLGAFAVIALLATRDAPHDQVSDFVGLGRTQPVIAALLTVFLLSLGGFPPTAGFVAKWYIFSAAVSAEYYSLAIIGVLTSVVAVFFYLRIVVVMYMADPAEARPRPRVPRVALTALMASVIVLLYLGILPTRIIDLAAASISTIF